MIQIPHLESKSNTLKVTEIDPYKVFAAIFPSSQKQDKVLSILVLQCLFLPPHLYCPFLQYLTTATEAISETE